MTTKKPFKLGVVEGFFGKSWSWKTRQSYAEFLSRYGFNAYLYAPKNDAFLRKDWQSPFPQTEIENLQSLCKTYQQEKLDFGIGLSPFELYRNFDTKHKTKLKHKLEEINAIGPDTLCILFDDMRGDFSNLAKQQASILDFVCEHSSAQNIIMCPTYYSDDPVLSAHFGDMPHGYLEDLGTLLPKTIDIFWTGPKVVSTQYPAAHLAQVTEKLQRKPILWDNYPVNDSKQLSNFLHLQPFANRSSDLKEQTNGHMANPMNQAFLSQLALHALGQIYQGNMAADTELYRQACTALCNAKLSQCLIEDASLFQDIGLDKITTTDKTQLVARYEKHMHTPMAKEVLAWLAGEYAFDPACLT